MSFKPSLFFLIIILGYAHPEVFSFVWVSTFPLLWTASVCFGDSFVGAGKTERSLCYVLVFPMHNMGLQTLSPWLKYSLNVLKICFGVFWTLIVSVLTPSSTLCATQPCRCAWTFAIVLCMVIIVQLLWFSGSDLFFSWLK